MSRASPDAPTQDARFSDESRERAVTAPASPPQAEPRETTRAGTTLGRYVVLEEVGRGGMGQVWRAYDPKLRREVALKVLSDRVGPDGQVRIVREAQALAKLSHPNVLPVYDIDEADGTWFIAMEYVVGWTLRDWLKPERELAEVLRVFGAAGRGLAAAHAAGLVHRDFKPHNVMVGEDGRVRVMDFGLARAQGDAAARSTPHGDIPGVDPETTMGTSLTQSGTVLGTPAYMAPEQHRGRPADARSDQYAFCVSLWNALFGALPFGAKAVAALVVEKDSVPAPPAASAIPRGLGDVVARGLRPNPDERWPSMEALLLELGRDPSRRNRVAVGVAATVALVLAVIAGVTFDRSRRRAACAKAGAVVFERWGDGAKLRVRTAMVATDVPYAQTAFDRTVPWLDRYAGDWAGARERSCVAFSLAGTLDDETYRRATQCLSEKQTLLSELVELLAHADPEAVQRAVTAAAKLAPVTPCTDPAWLMRQPVVPGALRAQVSTLRGRLARVSALLAAADYDEATEEVSSVTEEAAALGYPAVHARARVLAGEAAEKAGDYEAAEAELVEAVYQAGASGADDVAADAAIHLVFVSQRRSQPEAGAAWARTATMFLDRLGVAEDDVRRATLVNNLGGVRFIGAAFDEAREHYQQALGIRERLLGPEHPSVAATLHNLGAVSYKQADTSSALAYYGRALAIRERAFGEDHPDVAVNLNNMGLVYYDLDQIETARAHHERALALYVQAFGIQHPQVANFLTNLANTHFSDGQREQALSEYRRVQAIQEATLGPDHPDLAAALSNMGHVLAAAGAHDEALSHEKRALAIRLAAFGPDHPAVAASNSSLGDKYRLRGAFEQALEHYVRALETRERVFGSSHPKVGLTLHKLGQVYFELGAEAEAVRVLERALELRLSQSVGPQLGETRFLLARVLWDSKRDRERALSLATEARDGFRAGGEATLSELGEVERWLQVLR